MSLEITDELLEKVDNKVEDIKKEEELVTCPCCGKRTLKQPLDPCDDLMDQFMACAMTGEPYRQTYDLYKGKVHIDASCYTQQVSDRITRAASAIEQWRKLLVTRYDNLGVLEDSLRLYACVDRISVSSGAGAVFSPHEAVETILDEIADADSKHSAKELTDEQLAGLCDGWCALMSDAKVISGLPKRIVNSVVMLHLHMYNILLETGFDGNFWSRIKLA